MRTLIEGIRMKALIVAFAITSISNHPHTQLECVQAGGRIAYEFTKSKKDNGFKKIVKWQCIFAQ